MIAAISTVDFCATHLFSALWRPRRCLASPKAERPGPSGRPALGEAVLLQGTVPVVSSAAPCLGCNREPCCCGVAVAGHRYAYQPKPFDLLLAASAPDPAPITRRGPPYIVCPFGYSSGGPPGRERLCSGASP